MALLVSVGASSFDAVRALESTCFLAVHTGTAINRLEHAMNLIDVELRLRGYSVADDDAHRDSGRRIAADIHRSFVYLPELTPDDPTERHGFDAIAAAGEKKLEVLERSLRSHPNAAAAQATYDPDTRRALDDMRRLVAELDEDERGLLHDRKSEVVVRANTATEIIVFGSSLVWLVCAVWACIAVRMAFTQSGERSVR